MHIPKHTSNQVETQECECLLWVASLSPVSEVLVTPLQEARELAAKKAKNAETKALADKLER